MHASIGRVVGFPGFLLLQFLLLVYASSVREAVKFGQPIYLLCAVGLLMRRNLQANAGTHTALSSRP